MYFPPPPYDPFYPPFYDTFLLHPPPPPLDCSQKYSRFLFFFCFFNDFSGVVRRGLGTTTEVLKIRLSQTKEGEKQKKGLEDLFYYRTGG